MKNLIVHAFENERSQNAVDLNEFNIDEETSSINLSIEKNDTIASQNEEVVSLETFVLQNIEFAKKLKKQDKLSTESVQIINANLAYVEKRLGVPSNRPLSFETYDENKQLDVALEGLINTLLNVVKANLSHIFFLLTSIVDTNKSNKSALLKLKLSLQAVSQEYDDAVNSSKNVNYSSIVTSGSFGSYISDKDSKPVNNNTVISGVKQYLEYCKEDVSKHILQEISEYLVDSITLMRDTWVIAKQNDVDHVNQLVKDGHNVLKKLTNSRRITSSSGGKTTSNVGVVDSLQINIDANKNNEISVTTKNIQERHDNNFVALDPKAKKELVEILQLLIFDENINIQLKSIGDKMAAAYGFTFINHFYRPGKIIYNGLTAAVGNLYVQEDIRAVLSMTTVAEQAITCYFKTLQLKNKIISDCIQLLKASTVQIKRAS